MGVVDFILNVVALLLWLSWQWRRFDPLARAAAASLAGTVRPAEQRRFQGGWILPGILLLLVGRAALYWAIGAPIQWTPKLHLGAVVLAFRSDVFLAALLYSALGFVRALVVFYFWLLILVGLNRGITDAGWILKLLRVHAGAVGRWPIALQGLLLVVGVALLWGCVYPALCSAGILASAGSVGHWLEQVALLTVALVLTLRLLLPAILLLYFFSSYIYFGGEPFVEFIGPTAGTILRPLRRLPLKAGKLDLRPLAAIALIFLLLYWVPQYLEATFRTRNVALWPQ